MDDSSVRGLLVTLLDYSCVHDDWSHPLDDALAGLTAEQAEWRPGPNLMGVWDIVLHLANWNENMVSRVETGEISRPKEGAWPPMPPERTEAQWEAAKNRLRISLRSLRDLVEKTPLEKIDASPYGIPDLTCRFIHLAYHVGQIVKLRECRGW